MTHHQMIDWQSLMDKLEAIFLEFGHENIHKHREPVLELLRRYNSSDEDFKDHVHFDKSGYTKNLVREFGRDDSNAIVMCWAPRQESTFHAHESSRCFVKVLSGQLVEQQVEYPSQLQSDGDRKSNGSVSSKLLTRNDVCYIDDSIGVHKVANNSSAIPAITLHIYAPPYKKCRIFIPRDQLVESSGNDEISLSIDQSHVVDVTFVSKFGKKISCCSNRLLFGRPSNVMKLSHPFIAELKRYVANQNATLGPIVLNLCELIKIKLNPSDHRHEEIRNRQRKLSQVTDMIHAAHVFHRCVRDSPQLQSDQHDNVTSTTRKDSETSIIKTKRLHLDNVMSLLVGDYLLAQSSVDMADLRYPRTVGLIAKGLEDYTRGEFLKLQLVDNFYKRLLNSREVCEGIGQYAQLTCGSLLSNACLSAALLAGHKSDNDNNTGNPIHMQQTNAATNKTDNLIDLVYSFGFHTGSAHRLIEMLYCPDTNSEDDRDFIKSLDVRLLDGSIRGHLDRSVSLLNKLPDGEKRPILLEMLSKMRGRCLSK